MTHVFTYYDGPRRSWTPWVAELLTRWECSWARHGWVPVILTPYDVPASAHEYHQRVTGGLPTVNPRAYEDACWRRWSAMSSLGRQPALMADWDVFNFGWRPAEVPSVSGGQASGVALLHEGVMPSLVMGWGVVWSSVVVAAEDPVMTRPVLVGGAPHVSDMHVFARWVEENRGAHRGFAVAEYPNPPCKFFRTGAERPVIHFASDCCRAAGYRTKLDAIRAFDV